MSRGFNVREFRSVLDKNKGLTRATHFLVEFPVPKGLEGVLQTTGYSNRARNLMFYCKAAALPGLGLVTDDVHRYGYGPINRNPYSIVYNDIMAQLYVDGNNVIRHWFNHWMRLIVNNRTDKGMDSVYSVNGARAYEYSYKDDYAVDIVVSAFNPYGKEVSRVVLTDAYPNYIADIQLDWSAKNEHNIMPISITYKDWYDEAIQTSTGLVNNNPSIFGPTFDSFVSEINQAVENVKDVIYETDRIRDATDQGLDILGDVRNTVQDVTNTFRFL